MDKYGKTVLEWYFGGAVMIVRVGDLNRGTINLSEGRAWREEWSRWLWGEGYGWIWQGQLRCFRGWCWFCPRWSTSHILYSISVFSLSRVLLVNVSNSLAEVVLSWLAFVDTLNFQDGLVGVLGNFGSTSTQMYLLKLMNLARTHSLTCFPLLALAIFLSFWAATLSDIWLYN